METKEKYPWNLWLDGKQYKLEKGVEFPEKMSVENFRAQIYVNAGRRDIKVSTEISEDKRFITIQALVAGTSLTLAEQRAIGTKQLDKLEKTPNTKYSVILSESVINRLKHTNRIALSRYKDYHTTSTEFIKQIFEYAKEQNIDVTNWQYKLKNNSVELYLDEVAEYKFDNWFDRLTSAEQFKDKLYEVYERDEKGDIIEIYEKKFPDDSQVWPTGKYKTKMVSYDELPEEKKPKVEEIIELKFPQDFTCSPRKFAAIICDEADSRGIDTDKWRFDYKSKKDTLIVMCGQAAIKYQENEDNKKNLIKIPRLHWRKSNVDVLSEIFSELENNNGNINVFFGKHYNACTQRQMLAVLWYESTNPESPFIRLAGAQASYDEQWGECITLTLRKPQYERENPNKSAQQILEERNESGVGKLIEQPRDILRLEQEEKELLGNNQKISLQIKELLLKIEHIKQDIVKGEIDEETGLEVIKEIEDEIVDFNQVMIENKDKEDVEQRRIGGMENLLSEIDD